MNVLVINCGSSSLKYQLINSDSEAVLAKGLCERIGIDGRHTNKTNGGKFVEEVEMKNLDIPGLEKYLDNWEDCQKTFGEKMNSSKNYRLSEALIIADIDYDENIHDALVDAKNTALLFEKMEREKDTEFKLSPYISIGKGESFCYTPFADLLKDFCLEGA